jgi:hypothetical protein
MGRGGSVAPRNLQAAPRGGGGLSHGCSTAAHREQGPRGSSPGPWPVRAAGVSSVGRAPRAAGRAQQGPRQAARREPQTAHGCLL